MNESFLLGTFEINAVVARLPSPVLKLSDLALLKIVPVSTGKTIFPSLVVVVFVAMSGPTLASPWAVVCQAPLSVGFWLIREQLDAYVCPALQTPGVPP